MDSVVQVVNGAGTAAGKPLYRWLLALFMVTVVAAGWRYPALGFAVPVVMAIGMAGGFFRGRYVCGNYCPRGSFYDTLFCFIGGTRPSPAFFVSPWFRWPVMALLMGFMVWRLGDNPGDWRHWGTVFWSMCAITTAVGIPLGIRYRSRSWCSFCPVGTVASAVGGEKGRLEIGNDCRQCGVCEKACPMGLSIASHRDAGVVPHRDCIRCSSCIESCPRKVLAWPEG